MGYPPFRRAFASGAAVILEGDTVSLSASQSTGVQNIDGLKNKLSVPVWVDEFLINLGNTGAASELNGGDIRVQLRLNTDLLTNGYVPIWLLGSSRNYSVASGSGGVSFFSDQLQAPLFGAKLAKPMLLLPGEYIEAAFYHAGVLDTTALTARFLARGHVADPESLSDDHTRNLPWFSAFVGKLQTANADATEQSKESDLRNPFDVPLKLDRMVGVIGSVIAGTDFGAYNDPDAIDAGLQYCTATMVDESGRAIVRDLTPFAHLFQIRDFTWPVKAVMPPRSFYLLNLIERYSKINTTNTLQVMCSIVGSREAKWQMPKP